jgi:hypothetical protein
VLPSKHKAGRVYATFDGHYTDDYRPFVFVSEDYGATWRSLSAGLPETSINRIREHPRTAGVLVIAHERGVHVTNDGGSTWHALRDHRPTCPPCQWTMRYSMNVITRSCWERTDAGSGCSTTSVHSRR